MKKILAFAFIFFNAVTFAQVGVDTYNPNGTFHVDGAKDNFGVTPTAPQLSNDLVIKADGRVGIGTANPTAKLEIDSGVANESGLRFANINSNTIPTSGAFLGIDANGKLITVSQNINSTGFDNSTLGYIPVPVAVRRISPMPVALNGATVLESGCKRNPINGHYYCAYILSAGTNFYHTFELAKAIGGYVVTITNTAERQWIYDNILHPTNGYALNNNIWIGYNKITFPGNALTFRWITNENFKIDWTTVAGATPEHFFVATEPNNQGGNEGSCHIWNATFSPTRQWNDFQGIATETAAVTNPPTPATRYDQVIIEFNE